MDARAHQALALTFLAQLDPVARPRLSSGTEQLVHARRVFDDGWLDDLPLPGTAQSGEWFTLVAFGLARVARRHVVCTAHEAHVGDRSPAPQADAWLGVVVQMSGAQRWLTWAGDSAEPSETVTRAGDVLILPPGAKHDASLPKRPGRSVHLLFAITTELAGVHGGSTTTVRPDGSPGQPTVGRLNSSFY
ncbi:putative Cupin superfamily protein [Streptomyces murinus]